MIFYSFNSVICMKCDPKVSCVANLKAHICMKRDTLMRAPLTDRSWSGAVGANSGHKMSSRLDHILTTTVIITIIIAIIIIIQIHGQMNL